MCWVDVRDGAAPGRTRIPALLAQWRSDRGHGQRPRLWDGRVVTVVTSGNDWAIDLRWQPSSRLRPLDPLGDPELEHARRMPPDRDAPPAGTLPLFCWLDERSSTNLSAPRQACLLAEWREIEDDRGRDRVEGMVVSIGTDWSSNWQVNATWKRAAFLNPIDPLRDRELDAARRSRRSA